MSVKKDLTFTPMTTSTITTTARDSTFTPITTTTTTTKPSTSMSAGQSSSTAQSTENQTPTVTEETLSNLSTTSLFVTSTTQEHLKDFFAVGTLKHSTSSCFGANANPMISSCTRGTVIVIQSFAIAYKAASLNCTVDNVIDQDQFQLCCLSIENEDCQMTYNIKPNDAVEYIEKCNGKPSCDVMATNVLPQGCINVPEFYPNYMHINYYCIPAQGSQFISKVPVSITSRRSHVGKTLFALSIRVTKAQPSL
ncbi:uncharacterized protein LOC128215902 [Mya arenaria]|uniref:uncharacterized protein LOC128215902 n=1 Tax=Mya arenaria TaxID=6604 RepID=UPI0022E038A7|nr:uncharacterized protein LOC128215902 [Mya arenaria]